MTVLDMNFPLSCEQLAKLDVCVLYVRGQDFVVDVKYLVMMNRFLKDIYLQLNRVSCPWTFVFLILYLTSHHLITLGNSSTPKLSTRDTFPSINRISDISFGEASNTSAIHIAIDWDPTALHLRYQSTRERVITYSNIPVDFIYLKEKYFIDLDGT